MSMQTLSVNKPVHLVLLASEQLWPNLEAMCLLADRLKRVFIYHTDDRDRSVWPAHALRYLAQRHFRIEAELHNGGMQPRDVTDAVGTWLRRYPDAYWVFNATGGTKLMTAGILRFVGTENSQTWYRELQHGWFELVRAPDGRRIAARKLQVPSDLKALTEQIPVRLLLHAVWKPQGGQVSIRGTIQPLPIRKIATAFAEQLQKGVLRPMWKDAFEAAGLPQGDRREGHVFEEFVGGCLYALGVRNAVANVKLSRGVSVVQEVDIVVNHGGRVSVVDCTLREEKIPVIAEYQRCETIRRSIAGLGGGYLLVRPNAQPSDGERFVLNRGRIRLLEARDFARFCATLADFLGVHPIPEEAAEVDRIFAEAVKNRPLRGLAEPTTAAGAELAPATRRNVIDLVHWARELVKFRDEDWVAVRTPRGTFLVVDVGGLPGNRASKAAAVRARLNQTIFSAGLEKISMDVTVTKGGNSAYVWLRGEDTPNLVASLPQRLLR